MKMVLQALCTIKSSGSDPVNNLYMHVRENHIVGVTY